MGILADGHRKGLTPILTFPRVRWKEPFFSNLIMVGVLFSTVRLRGGSGFVCYSEQLDQALDFGLLSDRNKSQARTAFIRLGRRTGMAREGCERRALQRVLR